MKLLRFFSLLILASVIVTSCQKELGYEEGTATGSLEKDTNGDCLPILINGAYKKDTLLKAVNYAEVEVNLLTAGPYTIKTDTVNGYSFSASGSAAVTGLQTIRLQAAGRPIAPSVDVFTVNFSGTTCEFNVIVTGSGAPVASNDSIVADVNGLYTTFKVLDSAKFDDAQVSGYHVLNIKGLSNTPGDEAIEIGVGLPGTLPPPAGTYDATQYPVSFVGAAYTNAITNDIYFLVSGFTTPIPTPVFTINITSITSTKVVGTFSGAVPDISGISPDLQFTNGKFSVTIYP